MDNWFDAAPCGLARCDAQGAVIACNPGFVELLGRPLESVRGEALGDLLTPRSRLFYQVYTVPLLDLQGEVNELRLELVHADGRAIPVFCNARRRAGSDARETVLVFMAAPERTGFEDALLASRRTAEAQSDARQQRLATLSHELRTPLNAIVGFSELLHSGDEGVLEPEQHEQVGYILNAGRYLESLVDDLLGFAGLEARAPALDLQTLNAGEAVARVEALTRGQREHEGLTYHRDGGPPLALRADPQRLQQILLNLFSNAIKYTPRGGLIRCAWEPLGRYVTVHVADSGPGIPEAQRESVFEPFMQLDPGGVRRGVGLGLSISRELARSMEGALHVAPSADGGSCFTLTLPAATAETAEAVRGDG